MFFLKEQGLQEPLWMERGMIQSKGLDLETARDRLFRRVRVLFL